MKHNCEQCAKEYQCKSRFCGVACRMRKMRTERNAHSVTLKSQSVTPAERNKQDTTPTPPENNRSQVNFERRFLEKKPKASEKPPFDFCPKHKCFYKSCGC